MPKPVADDPVALLVGQEQEQRQRHRPRLMPTLPVQTEVSPEDRDTVVHWIYDVFLTQPSWPLDVLLPHAVALLDRFLNVCSIKKTQLQLLGVVCVVLAFKARKNQLDGDAIKVTHLEEVLRDCADGAVTEKEVRAWELLVLSKLCWDLNAITTTEYLDVYESLYPAAREEGAPEEDSESDSSCLSTARQICSFLTRDLRLVQSFPTHQRALASWLIASDQRSIHVHDDEAELRTCLAEVDSYLQRQLSSPRKVASPPGSPFRVTSSSTPKDRSKRPPLRERSQRAEGPRRRLQVSPPPPPSGAAASGSPSTSPNKENDDSAIGLGVTSEDLLEATASVSSKSSSNASSPDSGAGAEDVPKIDPKESLTSIENLEKEMQNVALEDP